MADSRPITEREFSDHVHHLYAHPEMEARLLLEVDARLVERRRYVDDLLAQHERRLSNHDRFIERARGAAAMLALVMGGGGVAFLIHVLTSG